MGDARRIAAASLVLGPLLFLVSNLIHPKEYATGHEREQLAKIADAYTRWQVAHLITWVAIAFFAFGVVALASLVRARDKRSGTWGALLGIGGLMALMGVLALDGFSWGITGEVWARSDAAGKKTAELMLHDLQSSEWNLMFYVPGLAWLLGMLVLSLGAIRTGLVPAWAGAMLAIGSFLVGLEGAAHSNVYFVIASVALLAGGVAMAVALAKPNAGAADDDSSRPSAIA
ncbi:MAG TPA: DUF4386 family protein [Solirubrobacteraceae bacterium]|jgi:hypothetical protein